MYPYHNRFLLSLSLSLSSYSFNHIELVLGCRRLSSCWLVPGKRIEGGIYLFIHLLGDFIPRISDSCPPPQRRDEDVRKQLNMRTCLFVIGREDVTGIGNTSTSTPTNPLVASITKDSCFVVIVPARQGNVSLNVFWGKEWKGKEVTLYRP